VTTFEKLCKAYLSIHPFFLSKAFDSMIGQRLTSSARHWHFSNAFDSLVVTTFDRELERRAYPYRPLLVVMIYDDATLLLMRQ
jgi:hypothetical protein